MKILLVNKFLYKKGGDALSSLVTGDLLASKGHDVIFWGMKHPLNPDYPYKDFFVSYVDLEKGGNLYNRIKIASRILYSFEARKKMEALVRIAKPDIVHLNNIVHQISPSILDVFKKYGIPVVMTLRDYKAVCASYYLMSHNKICRRCENGRYYHCFVQGCVRHSRSKSLVNTLEMYLHHKILHLYDTVNIFISPSLFLKSTIKEMGFKGRVAYLPNFVYLDCFRPLFTPQERSIVYFGRLSEEKGLVTLLRAMNGVNNITLKIIGEGPMQKILELETEKLGLKNIRFLGYKYGDELKNEIRRSMFVVLPSEWYENNPRTLLEGFALGKPAIGSNIGGTAELVKAGETGLTFEVCNAEDLRLKITGLANNPAMIEEMGRKARLLVERMNNPETHYKGLMDIYKEAIGLHHENITS